jgi:hypothetical protein
MPSPGTRLTQIIRLGSRIRLEIHPVAAASSVDKQLLTPTGPNLADPTDGAPPMPRPSYTATAVVLLLVMAPGVLHAAELSEQEFLRLHEQLQPSPDEPWRRIPWKIDLLDAQRAAARESKPIFIWAMDGHPLGCT